MSLQEKFDLKIEEEKENLIDKMQIQMNDLLSANQQLYHSQKKIQELEEENKNIEYESKLQQSHNEMTIKEILDQNKELLNKNNELSQIVIELQDRVQKLHEKKKELAAEVRNQKSLRQKMKDVFQSELEKQIKLHTESLQKTIENAIKDNHKMAAEIKSLHISLDEQHQHQIKMSMENEKLQQKIQYLQEMGNKKDQDILQLNENISRTKNKAKRLKCNLQELDKKLDFEFRKNNDLLNEKNNVEKEKDELVQNMNQLNKICNSISFDQNLKYIQYLQDIFEKYNETLEKMETSQQMILSLNSNIDEKEKKLKDVTDQHMKLNQKYNSMENELKRTKKSNEHLQRRNIIGNLFGTICHQQAKEISSARFIIQLFREKQKNNEDDEIVHNPINSQYIGLANNGTSIKHIIILIIMLKRWKHLKHSQNKLESDERNWWWIGNHPNPSGLQDSIKETFNDIKKLSKALKDTQIKLVKIQKENTMLKTKVPNIIEKLHHKDAKIQKYHEKILQAKLVIQNMIPSKQYQQLEQKCKIMQQQNQKILLHENKEKVKNESTQNEMEKLREENQRLLNENLLLSSQNGNLQKIIKEMKEDFSDIEDVLESKRKLVVCLQKGIRREQLVNQTIVSQCHHFAIENQRLNNELRNTQSLENI